MMRSLPAALALLLLPAAAGAKPTAADAPLRFERVPKQKTAGWACARTGQLRAAIAHMKRGDLPRANRSILAGIQKSGLCLDEYASLTAAHGHLQALADHGERCQRAFEIVRTLVPSYAPAADVPKAVAACFAKAKPTRVGLKSHRFVTRDGQRYLEGELDDPLRIARFVELRIAAGQAAPMTVRVKLEASGFSIPLAEVKDATYTLGLLSDTEDHLDRGHAVN